ncbi:MAG: SMI1/KNR4 family protein [Phycisphaerales bacterium]|nr:SMI1/KNR4 family protein [Phycisphaerales bacterium]
MTDFRELLLSCTDEMTLGTGASESAIQAVERSLGVRFPDELRQFYREVGWAHGPRIVIDGLGDDVPSEHVLERHARHCWCDYRPFMPRTLLPVMDDGMGNNYCVDVAEGPSFGSVVFWDHEHPDLEQQQPTYEAPDFAVWLRERVEQINEWNR